MSQFLQATLYGLLQGGLFAMIAVGFSLVWGIMNVINLAQGSFVIIGAYIAWELSAQAGLDPFVGMFIAAAILFVVGYLLQRVLINLVVNAPVYITLLLTFGIDLMLTQAMNIVFTGNFRSIPTSYASRGIQILPHVFLPLGRFLTFGVALVVTILLAVMVSRTRTGMSITATGMDRGAARLMGINARHVYALVFGIGAATAGMAGALYGTVGTFSPADGAHLTLISFVIAVLGGLGNLYGALAGGIVLGLIESWGGVYLPGAWENAIAFLVFVIVLLVRPQGLVGRSYYAARTEV
ncbi:MAG: branched-chain amino acid ABC transporter permease [Sciscionella sp.]